MEHYCGQCLIKMRHERARRRIPILIRKGTYRDGRWKMVSEELSGYMDKTVTIYRCPQCGYEVLYGSPYRIEYRDIE